MVCRVRLQSVQQLQAIRVYMDDVTTLLQTVACTNRLLWRLDDLLQCMKVKVAKSRNLSIRKGVSNDNIFSVNGERIPLLAEQLVQSLGRLYTPELSDNHLFDISSDGSVEQN